MGVLSDESDTSALFTESELDDSDLDFAARRPGRPPVASPRVPTNDAREMRFSSEDEEEEEPRPAPRPPPAAAPTWVGPNTTMGMSTRAAMRKNE